MKRKSYSTARSLVSFLFPMAIVRALARAVVEVKPGWETLVLVFDLALAASFIGVLAYTLYLMLHNIKVERSRRDG